MLPEAPLGRLAAEVAQLLIGKGKPQFTKHIDCGDYVVVINAANLQVTGKRWKTKCTTSTLATQAVLRKPT